MKRPSDTTSARAPSSSATPDGRSGDRAVPVRLVDGARGPEHAEQPWGRQHGQAVEGVIPERRVRGQRPERGEQCFRAGISPAQRFLDGAHGILEPDRILLIVRVVPMRPLVQGDARRAVPMDERSKDGLGQKVHDVSDL
jgi:hypothetical protein